MTGEPEDQRPKSSSSEESGSRPTLSIGSDGLTRRERVKNEREEAAARIAQDDTLDEPAKIDAIAKVRNWFNGDTKIVDAYMAGDIDAAAAVAKLAEPVDAEYSTANHGRALYREEMTARTQRSYHAPEKALEMWGPQEDFPERPEGEIDADHSTELLLWDLWFGVLHAAKRIPWTDAERQGKLVALVQALRARPDPPVPSPLTIPLKRNWIWESGTLWSDLVVLGMSVWEAWNNGCGCGAGWTLPEQHAWTNVNAFLARLVATGAAAGFAQYGARALAEALEQEIGRWQHHSAPHATQVALLLTVAAVWISIAGERMLEERCDDEVPRDAQISWEKRGDYLPWDGPEKKSTFCSARWGFWRRRFDQEAHNEELPEEVRELAAKSAARIQELLTDS